MMLPVRHIHDHLIWTHTGQVLAVWQVCDTRRAISTEIEDRVSGKDQRARLFRSLRGDPMLLSLAGQLDPTAVVTPTLWGVDVSRHPAWAEHAEAWLDVFDGVDCRRRSSWLVMPLVAGSWRTRAGATVTGAASGLARRFGLTPPRVSAAEARQAVKEAAALEKSLPSANLLRRATPGEILWICNRLPRRGGLEPTRPDQGEDQRGASRITEHGLRGPCLGYLDEVHLLEGGAKSADTPAEVMPLGQRLSAWVRALLTSSSAPNPFRHRFIQVNTPEQTTYQAFLALADVPAAWAWPGGEWLSVIDDLGPVDYVARLHIEPGEKAASKASRKANELSGQISDHQPRPGDEEAPRPPASSLTDAASQLDDYTAKLKNTPGEVEIQIATAIGVFGETQEACEAAAEAVRQRFNDDLNAVRPTGAQTALYGAFLPGTPTPQALRDYTQYLTADDLALAGPLVGGGLGDDSGPLWGVLDDSGCATPVYLDMRRWPIDYKAACSMGIFAELGAGKSVDIKDQIAVANDRGDRTIGFDRTANREYADFVESVSGGDCALVDVGAQAAHSVDPLRMFPGQVGADIAEAFYTQMLDLQPMSADQALLSETVNRVAGTTKPSSAAVIDELESAEADAGRAHEMARQLRAAARRNVTRLIFDDTLPVLDVDAAANIVFLVQNVALPSKQEMGSEVRVKRMSFDKRFGLELLAMLARITKTVAFADPSQFVLAWFDEAWWLTRGGPGTDGYEVVLELIRDNRKHGAGILYASHDTDDAGSDTLLGLLSAVVLARQRNRTLATKYVETLLGLRGAERDYMVKQITELSPPGDSQRVGETIFCDVLKRLGRVRKLIAPIPRINDHIHSDPEAKALTAEQES